MASESVRFDMQKIGLFGGTFNPIHHGHIAMAKAFADELALDWVIFLPAGEPYHKAAPQEVSAAQRLAMTELAIAADARFAVSDCDMMREGATYTIDTIKIFRELYPQAELWFLLGMDSLLQLATWYRWQELVCLTHFAVAPRDGQSLADAPAPLQAWLGEALANGQLKLLSAAQYPISSTEIRARLAQGEGTDEVLPKAVADYIRAHGLYQHSAP